MATDTATRIRDALRPDTGLTAADLARELRLGESTVRQALAALEKSGHAQRISGTGTGPRRKPDRWNPATPSPPATADPAGPAATPPDTHPAPADAPAGPNPVSPSTPASTQPPIDPGTASDTSPPDLQPDPGAPATEPTATPTTDQLATPKLRLRPGALQQRVYEFLTSHPVNDDFSPRDGFTTHAITKALGASSSGAVGNAAAVLVRQGKAVQTCEKPCRYAALRAAEGPAHGAPTGNDPARGSHEETPPETDDQATPPAGSHAAQTGVTPDAIAVGAADGLIEQAQTATIDLHGATAAS